MTFYKPDAIASRPIVATSEGGSAGSPYQLPNGAVTTFDLGSGSLWVNMPANPQSSDTVTLKNARGKYFETTGNANVLTVNANGHELEVPGLNDTGSFLPTTGSFATSHPRFATRWIFVDGDPNGTWVIDQDYSAGAAITRVSSAYTLHPSELVMVDTSGGNVTVIIPEGLPDDSWFTIVKQADSNVLSLETSGAELLYSPDHSIGDPASRVELVSRAESITYVKTSSAWEPVNSATDGAMRWRGEWSSVATYHRLDVVRDGLWTMIANQTTTERAAPVGEGNPDWASELPGTPPPFTINTAAQPVWMTGNRYIPTNPFYIDGARFYMPDASGNFTYEGWFFDGSDLVQLVAPIVPASVGWVEVPQVGLFVPGRVLDLVIVGRAVSQPNTFASTWDVKNTGGSPSSGEANFQGSATEIRVHNDDKNDVDQSANLQAVAVGGTLQFAGLTWTITEVDVRGSHVRYHIEPNQGRPSEDEYLLSFSWGATLPIPYGVVPGHFMGIEAITGFEDTRYPPAVFNENMYGVDLRVDLTIGSDHWDVISFSG